MEDFAAVREYLKRLKRLINEGADLTFFQYKFVKISRVEDLLACILGLLPTSYIKAMKMKSKSSYRSVVAFNALNKTMKRKFFLLPDCYMVPYGEVNLMLETLINSIVTDVETLENLD